MAYRKGEDKDKSVEGTKWTVISLISGGLATISPHPLIKLVALFVAIASGTNAVNCYKSSAKTAYQRLPIPKKQYRLPPP